MRHFVCLLTLCLALAANASNAAAQSAAPSPSAAPASAAPATPRLDDPKMKKLALEQIDVFLGGKIDRSKYSASFNEAVTDAKLAAVAAQVGPLGKPSSVAFSKVTNIQGIDTYLYEATWPQVVAIVGVGLNKDGKIEISFIQPKK